MALDRTMLTAAIQRLAHQSLRAPQQCVKKQTISRAEGGQLPPSKAGAAQIRRASASAAVTPSPIYILPTT